MVATDQPVTRLEEEAVGIFPRQYQRDGIEFLWNRRRVMLTDAPGLGKTPQSALASEPPAIVVAPTYLVGQWAEWLAEHLPNRRVVVAKGDRWKKVRAINAVRASRSEDHPVDFFLINKEMLRTHADELQLAAREGTWNTLICDEAHHLRSYKAEVAKGAVALARNIPRVYLLTATPIWKEVDDLFMQFRILQPGHFKSYNAFVQQFCMTDNTRWGTKVLGAKKEMRGELEELLNIMRLGRNYTDVGRELPKAISTTVTIELDDHMRKVYDRAVEEYRVQFEAQGESVFLLSNSAVMHTLRQLTGYSGKIDTVREVIEEAIPFTNGRAIVFTWYTDEAEAISAELRAHGHEVVTLTGQVKADERRRLADGTHGIVVANIAALSEGVDLSWARHVVFAEEHWPPGSATQSLARVVRERQTTTGLERDIKAANSDPVIVQYVVVKDTIDEVIHKTARRRQATIKDLMRETLGFYD